MNEWDQAIADLTDKDWQEIETMNTEIQSHSGSWGKMAGGDEIKPGMFQMPYAVPEPLIHRFLEIWYEKNLVIAFDWAAWDEGREWYANKDEAKYDKLDAITALKLITAVIRNDRFNEGALMHTFEDGTFPKIISRFVSLKEHL